MLEIMFTKVYDKVCDVFGYYILNHVLLKIVPDTESGTNEEGMPLLD
jgi:hypothetical protein